MPNLLSPITANRDSISASSEKGVQAGDAIVRTRRGRHERIVADIDPPSYLPDRDWACCASPSTRRDSAWLAVVLHHLLAAEQTRPRNGPGHRRRAWSGFRRPRVAGIDHQSCPGHVDTVRS